MDPLLILVIGVAIVVSLILIFRINAFFALITSAIVASLLAPGNATEKITRVGIAFGDVAGAIGIVIAMAAVIGWCLMESGAAQRIVDSLGKLMGEKRAPAALAASSFVLSVPVFFDTVFYLVIPVIRSMWRKRQKNYVLLLTSVVAGGAVTHSMVPPTPGPLFMANELEIDLGMMILVGSMIGIPMAIVGLLTCHWLDRHNTIEMRPYPGEEKLETDDKRSDLRLPPLSISLFPILLPVVLIATNTFANSVDDSPDFLLAITAIAGNPSLALLISAAMSLCLVAVYRGKSLADLNQGVEQAVTSAGFVILITSAGGAFGAMLRDAGIKDSFSSLLGNPGSVSGSVLLLSAFGVASLIKIAQGSGTVAMITTASIFASMEFSSEHLGCHPAYLACAIGSGSLVGDWMNNSGFWIFAKMGVLTTEETLRTWSILTAALGVTGILATILMSWIVPFSNS